MTDWQHQYQTGRDQVEDKRYEDETAYQKQQDSLKWAYQKDSDAYDRVLTKWQLTGVLDAESAEILGLPADTKTSDYLLQMAQRARMDAGGSSGGGAKKSGDSGSAQKEALNSNSAGIIESMLLRGSQALAYEELISRGLPQGKTDQLWKLYLEESAKVEAGKAGEKSGWVMVRGYGRLTQAEVDAMVKRGDIIKSYDAKTGRYSYRKRSN